MLLDSFRRRTGWIRSAVAVAVTWGMLASGIIALTGVLLVGKPARATAQPNVVIVLADDQRAEEIQGMPNVQSELVAHGVSFTNALISNPLCCPSRATILTGLYSHHNGVYTNGGGSGGWSVFKQKDESRTLATSLHAAGYRTALIGKYLNGYGKSDAGHVPSGWDRWFALLGGTGSNWYYDYWISDQGAPTYFGDGDVNYSTDVLAGEAVQFIQNTPAEQPLFLYFTPFAPHFPSIAPTRYAAQTASMTLTSLPDFNEADVSDKPAYIQAQPFKDPAEMATLWNKHWGASRGADDAVGRLVDTLRSTGRLSNTLFVYLSDQGVELGEHRWLNKEVPYESVIRTPLVIRWDELMVQPHIESALVGNVDLGPTIGAATGAAMPRMDGKSILPLMTGSTLSLRDWFLLEHGTTVKKGHPVVPGYCAARSRTSLYVEYVNGEREFYDFGADPYELQNAVTDPMYAAVVDVLHARLANRCPQPPLTGSNAEDT